MATGQQYDFLHETPVTGLNYYHLKQFELDRSFDYSNIVSVNFTNSGDWQSQMLAYPNPTSDFIFLKVLELDDPTVELIDSQGRTVLIKKEIGKINVSALIPGLYYVRVTGNMADQSFVTLISVAR